MTSRIEIERITPHTGAVVRNVSLANPSQEEIEALKQTLTEHMVLVFPDQDITQEQHKNFARHFGSLHKHPGVTHLGFKGDPEMFIIDTKATSKYSNGEAWHSDVSCDPRPPMASLLYVKEPPPDGGGDTLFANMYSAFEALSQPLKELLLPLRAFHDGVINLAEYDYDLKPGQTYPAAEHPVITRHPESGRPILFVNGSFTSHICGLSRSESDALLTMLYEHTNNPRWHCRVRWMPNTVTMWDNRCLQHHAVWDYYPNSRYAERVTVQCPEGPAAYQAAN